MEEIFEGYKEDGSPCVASEEAGYDGEEWVYHGEAGDNTQEGDENDDTDLVAWTADSSLRDVDLDVFPWRRRF